MVFPEGGGPELMGPGGVSLAKSFTQKAGTG